MTTPRPPRRPRLAVTLVLLLAAACGGAEHRTPTETPVPPVGSTPTPSPPTPPPPAVVLTELWIEGGYPQARLAADTLEQNIATGRLARGRTASGEVVDATAEWSSSDTTVMGLGWTSSPAMTQVITRTPGTTVLTARAGTLSASIPVVVTVPHVRGVFVQHAPTPDVPFAAWINQPDSLIVRAVSRYVAACTTGGSGGARLDRPITWRTSDTTRAAVDSAGTVTARAVGPVALVVTCTGVFGEKAADTVRLVVRPPRAARLAFTYAPDSVTLYHSDTLRAVLYDSSDAPTAIPVRFAVPVWGDPPWGVKDGVFTPIALGTVEVVASGDGLSARRSIRVVPVAPAPPQTFPAVFTLATGTFARLGTRAVDLDGNDWSLSATTSFGGGTPGVASVSADGIVTAGAPGTATVHVQTGATSADVPVTVVAPGAFSVTTRRLGPANAALDAALRTAADAWGHAILADLPDLQFTLPPDVCDGSLPAEELTVDDVIVFARAAAIDGVGGTLAMAGPCVIRGDGTAAVGLVVVDSADIAPLDTQGQLATVVRHEMGHVLGIGTLWSRPELGLVRSEGGGWLYVGTRGLRVGRWWKLAFGTLGVGLGESNGAGSGHWSESVFGNELMTPTLNRGPNPLSLLTLEALGDLGYVTAATAAEPFGNFYPAPYQAAPGLSANRVPAASTRAPIDRLFTARYRVAGRRLVRIAPPRLVR